MGTGSEEEQAEIAKQALLERNEVIRKQRSALELIYIWALKGGRGQWGVIGKDRIVGGRNRERRGVGEIYR